MRTKALVAVLVAGVVFYLVLLGQRAWMLLTSGSTAGVLLGVGVLALPLLVGWAVWRELRFGLATQRLARDLDAAPGVRDVADVADLPRRPSGRVDRAAADAAFSGYRAAVEAAPQDWRAWYRLAQAYDAAGDRRRARAAMRHAVSLHG